MNQNLLVDFCLFSYFLFLSFQSSSFAWWIIPVVSLFHHSGWILILLLESLSFSWIVFTCGHFVMNNNISSFSSLQVISACFITMWAYYPASLMHNDGTFLVLLSNSSWGMIFLWCFIFPMSLVFCKNSPWSGGGLSNLSWCVLNYFYFTHLSLYNGKCLWNVSVSRLCQLMRQYNVNFLNT